MLKLSPELKQLVRQFASDRLPPTPTADLIKTLQFKYKMATDNVIYLPRRLEVRAKDAYFIRRKIPSGQPLLATTRTYYLSDFQPSYWSDYADTMDRGDKSEYAYDDNAYGLMRRLQAES